MGIAVEKKLEQQTSLSSQSAMLPLRLYWKTTGRQLRRVATLPRCQMRKEWYHATVWCNNVAGCSSASNEEATLPCSGGSISEFYFDSWCHIQKITVKKVKCSIYLRNSWVPCNKYLNESLGLTSNSASGDYRFCCEPYLAQMNNVAP